MKKLIALLMIVSFVTVTAAGAFADPRSFGRGRISGRVERRDSDRRIRPNYPSERRVSRPVPLDRRSYLGRPDRHDRVIIRRDRPLARRHYGFFNRPRYYDRRPAMLYSGRPHYYGHRHSSSLSPLEFFGIGAVILAVAAAANSAYYDY